MGYELYLLPLPSGADIEEAGEALLARLLRFHEVVVAPGGADDGERLAERLRAEEPELSAASAPPQGLPPDAAALPVVELRDPSGLQVTLARRFARVRLPFAYTGRAAAEVFDHVFRVLGALVGATGWSIYDPQAASGVGADEEGCGATLEMYLTVMDQLSPSGPARDRPPARPA